MSATVLLVPTDPSSPLLADGPCGARPPMMMWYPYQDGKWVRSDHGSNPLTLDWTRALVLAHAGVPVAEGCDRAARVLGRFWWGEERVKRWASGDRTATHLIDPMAPCRVVVIESAEAEAPHPLRTGGGY